jgi:pyrimidine nucleoside transport protein
MGSKQEPVTALSPAQIHLVSSDSSPQGLYADDSGNYFELTPVKRDELRASMSSQIDTCQVILEDRDSDASFDKHSDSIVYRLQNFVMSGIEKYRKWIVRIIAFLALAGYTVYFAFAIDYNLEWAIALIVITCLTVFFLVYGFIRDHYGDSINEHVFEPISEFFSKHWHILQWFVYPALIIATILYLGLEVVREVRQLQSLTGIVVFIVIMYLTSKYPDKIIWRPVVWGFFLQFVLAILVLRWEYGYIAVKFLADEITKFIEFGYAGAAVVFGDPFLILHPFSFMGMPLLIYVGSVMAILYYLGITQVIVVKLGWLMQVTMGTTAIESLNTTANIFLNGMDTMLMLRYYLDKLTRSEFNCFLVGNHATVAGFVFALFVLFGAPPQHLLSAAVMSAPATIAICKLNYPETEKSITKDLKDVQLSRGDDINVFEAAANGAGVAAKTVASVVACYIAFMSMLEFINAFLAWIGGRVGHDELSFELICSYVMWPIAFLCGIDYSECQEAAKLIGIKLFATELLAYQELGKSGDAGLLNKRNQALTTYAMCGFSSISTLAIAVGVWNAVCPQRVKQMASSMFRVLVQANISCFMTACVAGLFYSTDIIEGLDTDSSTPTGDLIGYILGLIPSYKELMSILNF